VFKFKALSLKYRTGRYGKRWIVHICAEAALIIPLLLLAEWIKPPIFGQKSDTLPTQIFSVQNCALPRKPCSVAAHGLPGQPFPVSSSLQIHGLGWDTKKFHKMSFVVVPVELLKSGL
jgi:hypothetical protein